MTSTTQANPVCLDRADLVVIEVFERHLRWEAPPCVICGEPGGPECVRCHVDHDKAVERSGDL